MTVHADPVPVCRSACYAHVVSTTAKARERRFWLWTWLTAFILSSVASSASQATVMGGWDTSRGGSNSVSGGSSTAGLRSLLQSNFPGLTFSGSNTLTPAYLATVDTVVLAAAFSPVTPITPLSPAEQSALFNFVLSGHTALLMGDHNSFSAAVNTSMMSPFGAHITGDVFGTPSAIVTNPLASVITNGPFGTLTTVPTSNPGWFDLLGLAQGLANLPANNQPVLAVLGPNALGAGSGAVVLSADEDTYGLSATLALNTTSFLLPEPSSFALAACGITAFVACERRRWMLLVLRIWSRR